MIKLKKLDADTYANCTTVAYRKELNSIVKDYYNYVYTAALDYLQTGDYKILNNVVAASKVMRSVNVTKRLVGLVNAHKRNEKTQAFQGKADTKRMKHVRTKWIKPADLKEAMEDIINADQVKKEKKAATFNADQVTTRAVNALATLLAHGEEVDLAELLKLAQAQKDSVKLKSTPVVEVGADATEVQF